MMTNNNNNNNKHIVAVLIVLGATLGLIGLVNMDATTVNDGTVTSLVRGWRRRLEDQVWKTKTFDNAGVYKASVVGAVFIKSGDVITSDVESMLCKEVYVPFLVDKVGNNDYQMMIEDAVKSDPELPEYGWLDPDSFEYKGCQFRKGTDQNIEWKENANFPEVPFSQEEASGDQSKSGETNPKLFVGKRANGAKPPQKSGESNEDEDNGEGETGDNEVKEESEDEGSEDPL